MVGGFLILRKAVCESQLRSKLWKHLCPPSGALRLHVLLDTVVAERRHLIRRVGGALLAPGGAGGFW